MRGIDDLKERITVTLDKKLLDFLDEKIKQRVFANRSHALEYLARRKIKQEAGYDFSSSSEASDK